jgi:hypothetical protein
MLIRNEMMDTLAIPWSNMFGITLVIEGRTCAPAATRRAALTGDLYRVKVSAQPLR